MSTARIGGREVCICVREAGGMGVCVPGRGSARMLKFSVDVNKWHLIGSQ